jgi:hypothetical protein
MKELLIETMDNDLYDDLSAANIPGLTLRKRDVSRMDSADVASTIQPTVIVVFIIAIGTIAKDVAVSLFQSWLYDRFKNEKSHKTTINGIDITHDVTQINTVINNYLQENRN